jgi:hypothetical protein
VPARSDQNRARAVWSGVRAVLSTPPTDSTWWYSAAYRAEVIAGGEGGWNCEPLLREKVVTRPHCGSTGGA